ncbi:MAG: SDR family oxidoreductase [Chloroflexota bacterium]|nr:SDR family oxidoreductase [Chloroflexota bacterium]
MILVAGGTGTLGTELVQRLVTRDARVRILSRNAAKHPASPQVEVVEGDVRDRRSLERAVAGVATVVSAVHGFLVKEGPRAIDRDGNRNLIAAARSAGAEHFVLVSIAGASADSPMELFRMKYAAEQDLKRSGLSWTIVRPTSYMETWLGLIAVPLLQSGKVRIFGRGQNPINFVSANDVAGVMETAVMDPAKRGAAIDVGGPEDLSFVDFVRVVEEAMGKKGATSHVPLPMMKAMAVLMKPLNPTLARQIQGGVVMDTTDLTFATVKRHASSWIQGTTSLREVVVRDYVRDIHHVVYEGV